MIAIDELDKMESEDSAREFLNNVKGVFGVKGCYYLVSVSEDAMSAFERRGLPIRDVFDSSFDAIQRVGYLTLEESRTVLAGRLTGLPVPFQSLCHALSAGLPRDLIRVTRELVQRGEGEEASLGSLCGELVGAERERKLAAAHRRGGGGGRLPGAADRGGDGDVQLLRCERAGAVRRGRAGGLDCRPARRRPPAVRGQLRPGMIHPGLDPRSGAAGDLDLADAGLSKPLNLESLDHGRRRHRDPHLRTRRMTRAPFVAIEPRPKLPYT